MALVQLGLTSALIVLVIGTIGAYVLRQVATNEALDGATRVTAAFARGVIGPGMTAAVLRGDQPALDRFDAMVRARVLRDPIVRVKVWTADGRIAYSDEPALIGRRFTLDPDVRAALADDQSMADISTLSRAENTFERNRGRLVEVYLAVRAATGQRLVVEVYQSAGSIDERSHRIWVAFLPVAVVMLLVLGLAQLPLAASLTRRVRHQEQERERLESEASKQLEAERLRIAAELHDGVVQDLAGVAYELQAVADQLPDDPHASPGAGLRDIMQRGAHICRDSVRALRTLLVDLSPGDRRAAPLDAALDALAEPLRERGLSVAVDVELSAPVPPDVAELVHRATHEALRNVARHAGARTVAVLLSDRDHAVTLTVEDDGRGMSPGDLEAGHAAGHMGLRLLAGTVNARGGRIEVVSEPGRGTRVTMSLPVRAPVQA